MTYQTLQEEWRGLLERRPTFRASLAPYARILETWVAWPGDRVDPLRWTAGECQDRWRRGVPLLAETAAALPREEMEDLLSGVMEVLAAMGEETEALRRFAEAWDRGEIAPADLFPGPGRVGTSAVQQRTGLSQEALAFLAYGSLRPILEAFFAECGQHLTEGAWDLGVCPLCGAPPGYVDLLETGQRRLACHVCGAGWVFSRLRCPYCGNRNVSDLVRLQAEEADEGYLIEACKACQGYLKGLDRRVRWNAGSALVEDWGSPHLDLIAHGDGYWRAIPTLIELQRSE